MAPLLHNEAGVSVTYAQGATIIDSVTAVPNTKMYRIFGDDRTSTWIESNDWLVKTSWLDGIIPRAGDVITDVSTGDIYEVMPIDDENCFKSHDNAKTQFVVHSKRIQ